MDKSPQQRNQGVATFNFGQNNMEKLAGIITTSTEYEYTVDIKERGRLADDRGIDI